MIGSMRETNLIAPLVGGTLMATVLLGVSACAALPFSHRTARGRRDL